MKHKLVINGPASVVNDMFFPCWFHLFLCLRNPRLFNWSLKAVRVTIFQKSGSGLSILSVSWVGFVFAIPFAFAIAFGVGVSLNMSFLTLVGP